MESEEQIAERRRKMVSVPSLGGFSFFFVFFLFFPLLPPPCPHPPQRSRPAERANQSENPKISTSAEGAVAWLGAASPPLSPSSPHSASLLFITRLATCAPATVVFASFSFNLPPSFKLCLSANTQRVFFCFYFIFPRVVFISSHNTFPL